MILSLAAPLGALLLASPLPGAPLRARPDAVPVPAPGAAICEVEVDGVGLLAMEDDYVPQVAQCENGGADLEALKAQAIAARSVAYYAMLTSGSICDGQGCQVYGCGKAPSAMAVAAAEATRGQILSYNDVLTYGFYVAGDPGVTGPACVGDPNGGATEKWVTYNDGKSGADVTQTMLGSVFNPGDTNYGQNRGCMSQWGARCLEGEGRDALGILRFFYGADIQILQTEGPCVPDVGGSTGGSTGGGTGGSTGGTGGSTGGTGGSTGGTGGSTGGGTGGGDSTSTGPGATAGGTGGGNGLPFPEDYGGGEDSGGCGCRAAAPSAAPFGLIILLLLARGRRARA